MHDLFFMVPLSALSALCFALFLVVNILKESEGTLKMREIAQAVREGAEAYLRQQYLGVLLFFCAVFVILLIFSFLNYIAIFMPQKPARPEKNPPVKKANGTKITI